MTTRKKRIIQWTIVLCLGLVINDLSSKPEKQTLTVYAPSDMEKAFDQALDISPLKETHEIIMTDNPNANICVEYQKQNDATYQKFAYSPFAVAYNDDKNCLKKLVKKEVCVQCKYNEDYYEIDFLKVIEEATEGGDWSDLGIEEHGKLKVFYPDKESIYWNDFHDFMLVTLNDGIYPENESKLKALEKSVDKFINSKYTQGVTDFNEQVRRTGGFPANVIYILPEKDLNQVCYDQSQYARLLFPLKTVYFNYYAKGDELGKQIIDSFDKTSFFNDFYMELKRKYYRVDKYPEVIENSYVYDGRDIYDVVQIPVNNEFEKSQETE